MWGSPWLAEDLLASLEGLCFILVVSHPMNFDRRVFLFVAYLTTLQFKLHSSEWRAKVSNTVKLLWKKAIVGSAEILTEVPWRQRGQVAPERSLTATRPRHHIRNDSNHTSTTCTLTSSDLGFQQPPSAKQPHQKSSLLQVPTSEPHSIKQNSHSSSQLVRHYNLATDLRRLHQHYCWLTPGRQPKKPYGGHNCAFPRRHSERPSNSPCFCRNSNDTPQESNPGRYHYTNLLVPIVTHTLPMSCKINTTGKVRVTKCIIQARSRNNFCSGKASSTYWVFL